MLCLICLILPDLLCSAAPWLHPEVTTGEESLMKTRDASLQTASLRGSGRGNAGAGDLTGGYVHLIAEDAFIVSVLFDIA